MNKMVVSSDEDGEWIFAVLAGKKLTRLGAWRGIRKMLRDEYGFSEWDGTLPLIEDLEAKRFWETNDEEYEGGEYENYTWWEKPDDVPVKYIGWGWIYQVYEH